METYKDLLDMQRIPTHIAVIMDGNGRWAKAQGLPRTEGHKAGVETVKKITSEAVRLGVKYLTLYTFSMENWNRPAAEVAALMALVLTSLEEEIFHRNKVRFRVIGDIEMLPAEVQEKLEECMQHTACYDKMTMIVALSYSSRWEITRAARLLAEDVKAGKLTAENITEEEMNKRMVTNFMPDPDLLIRTGGEFRISNYLLWQCAYTELYFTKEFWPDFNEESLCHAIYDYQQRERRFGKTSEQVEQTDNNGK